jgi:hypothetical protein
MQFSSANSKRELRWEHHSPAHVEFGLTLTIPNLQGLAPYAIENRQEARLKGILEHFRSFLYTGFSFHHLRQPLSSLKKAATVNFFRVYELARDSQQIR